MSATAARWATALDVRPTPGKALDVLVPTRAVLVRRPDDIPGETDEFQPATGELGAVLAELEARTPLFAWDTWWQMLRAAIRGGRPGEVRELLAAGEMAGWA